jgi:hypothetical protein
VGFQLRISTSIFLHTQFNYQVNLSSSINNNLAASIGLLGTILHRKKKTKLSGQTMQYLRNKSLWTLMEMVLWIMKMPVRRRQAREHFMAVPTQMETVFLITVTAV